MALFRGPKKSSNSKESSETFPRISQQIGPFLHKMKGFSKISRQKVHLKFAKNLGRLILGNNFSGPNCCVLREAVEQNPEGAFPKGNEISIMDHLVDVAEQLCIDIRKIRDLLGMCCDDLAGYTKLGQWPLLQRQLPSRLSRLLRPHPHQVNNPTP